MVIPKMGTDIKPKDINITLVPCGFHRKINTVGLTQTHIEGFYVKLLNMSIIHSSFVHNSSSLTLILNRNVTQTDLQEIFPLFLTLLWPEPPFI